MTGGESNKGTKEGAAAEEKETYFEISRLEFGGREETKSVVANLMLSLRSAAFNGNWGESGSNISASHIPTLISIWIELNIVLRCDSGPIQRLHLCRDNLPLLRVRVIPASKDLAHTHFY